MRKVEKSVFMTLSVSLCMMVGIHLHGQSTHKLKRQGDMLYENQDFLAAEEQYRKARSLKGEADASYNLGNAIYQQQRYEEAVQHFEEAVRSTKDPKIKSLAYHNLGNTHFGMEAYDKSIQSYKEALKINPNDLETKQNLTLALQQLRLQQQQQQQQENQDNNQEEKEDQENQEDQQEQQEQQQSQAQEDEEKEEQQSPEKRDLTKEEAEELLRIIENEDQKVQEKLRKASASPNKSKKDW